jgi:hypothetical protein
MNSNFILIVTKNVRDIKKKIVLLGMTLVLPLCSAGSGYELELVFMVNMLVLPIALFAMLLASSLL